jgi:toxin-antitoxin system PIN domain toxin
MIHLLDVNFLVALFDPQHVNHEASHSWFAGKAIDSWATCPITENGFVRVISDPAYPTIAATPKEAMKHLDRFCTTNGHVFWADNISLLKTLSDSSKLRLTGHQQVTDFYLAALAEHNGGKLATFDGSLAKCLAGTELDQNIEVIT